MALPARTRLTVLTLLIPAGLLLYWLIFLAQPLVEGNDQLTRGSFVLSCLVYPEGLISTWSDGGRLATGGLDRWPIVLGTLAWLALAMIVGWPWCAAVVPRPRPHPQQLRFACWLVAGGWSCLVGLAMLSTVTLLVGLAGGLSSPLPLIIALLIVLVLGYVVRRSQLQRMTVATTAALAADEWQVVADVPRTAAQGLMDRSLYILTITLTVWCATVIMLGAWVPPSEFDVLEYHLQAPKEFYQLGGIEFLPHNIYANMPLGIEMHSLAAMVWLQQPDAWLGGLIGKSISAALSLVGAGLLGGTLALRYGPLCGWLAAGIWLSTPGIAHVAMQGLIDGGLATYTLASALASWHLMRTVTERSTPTTVLVVHWAAITSVLSGAAAAIKYPGLVFVTLPGLLVVTGCAVILWRRSQRSRAWQVVSISGLGLAITCGPWYAKNWWLSGNPVYPLAANLFGGATLTPEKIAQWQSAHRSPPLTQVPDDLMKLLLSSAFVQPAMIFGVCVAAISLLINYSRRPGTAERGSATQSEFRDCLGLSPLWYLILAWSLWILLVWLGATHRIDRFWLPVTGLWSALAAWGLSVIGARRVWLAYLLALPGLVYGAMLNSSPVVSDNRYFVALSALRDDAGDEQHIPRVPLAQSWINEHYTDQSVRLLLIGEARIFEYRVPVMYSTCFDTNPGESMLAGRPASEQIQALRDAGITHLMVNWTEIERYRSPGNYGFSAWPTRQDMQQLVDDGVLAPVPWNLSQQQAQLFEVSGRP